MTETKKDHSLTCWKTSQKKVCTTTNLRFPCTFCLKASPPYIPGPQFHDAHHSPKIIEYRESKFFQMYFCILFFIFKVYEVRTNSLFWRPVSVSDDVGGDLRKKPQIFSPSLSLPSFSYNIDIFIICQLKVIRGWILVKKHFTNKIVFASLCKTRPPPWPWNIQSGNSWFLSIWPPPFISRVFWQCFCLNNDWNIMLKIVSNNAAVSDAINFKNKNFSPMSKGFAAEP